MSDFEGFYFKPQTLSTIGDVFRKVAPPTESAFVIVSRTKEAGVNFFEKHVSAYINDDRTSLSTSSFSRNAVSDTLAEAITKAERILGSIKIESVAALVSNDEIERIYIGIEQAGVSRTIYQQEGVTPSFRPNLLGPINNVAYIQTAVAMLAEQKYGGNYRLMGGDTPEIDPFLRSLVDMVDKDEPEGFGFGITLSVGGFLLAGTLVGGRQFFRDFGEKFGGALDNTNGAGKSVAETFANWADVYKIGERPAEFIHIKNAAFFTTNQRPIPSNNGTWWRGKLSDVTGFSLGALEAS